MLPDDFISTDMNTYQVQMARFKPSILELWIKCSATVLLGHDQSPNLLNYIFDYGCKNKYRIDPSSAIHKMHYNNLAIIL
jgi:hypothetical protein